ncbi:MAG TPA: tetratricopeptide repeat protein [Rubricoccaceae bacterium]|nr:tetratricopeptide repeat protein [Rubricoccaceae bacterium]
MRLRLPASVLLSALAGLAACRSDPPAAPAAAAWTYVGDEACASCHERLYTDYHRTGMGRSVTKFDPDTAPEQFDADGRSPVVCHPASGYCYQAFVRGDTLYQREFRRDTPAYERVHAVSHVVGSGNATRSYFMTARAIDDPEGAGYLTEMPLTWYVERALWDLSPGYSQTNSRFDRPITVECLACHDGPPGYAKGTQNFYTDVPLGITCERCHGPGSAHVEARLEGGEIEGADSTIVNPARLSPELQLAVCQQCHLSGTTVFKAGEDPTTYRPGRPLSAHRTVFAFAEHVDDPEAFGISSHALRMMQSACFTETRGTDHALTCTTCHDPHQPVAEADPDAFNAACRTCHRTNAHADLCARPGARTPADAMTGDCVSCHMRKSGTSDIPHVAFTDHWIRRRPPPPSRRPVTADRFIRAAPFRLVDVTARERALAGGAAAEAPPGEADLEAALAYFHVYEVEHPLTAYLPQIIALARRGLDAGAERADARVALGRALAGLDSLAEAELQLEEAARLAPADARAAYWLGWVRLRRGNAPGAVEALQRAVENQPRFTEARVKLAEALVAAGRPVEAVAEYEEAVRRDPVRHPEAWNNLGFLLLQRGDFTGARRALTQAIALDPRLVEARANLGAVALAEGQLEDAAAQLQAALRADPSYVPALGNLGVVRQRQGRNGEARRLFERVLALSPGDPQAAAHLRGLGG